MIEKMLHEPYEDLKETYDCFVNENIAYGPIVVEIFKEYYKIQGTRNWADHFTICVSSFLII